MQTIKKSQTKSLSDQQQNARSTSISRTASKKRKTKLTIINDVPAGFPSPASDAIQQSLDLNQLLIQHPAATFFVKVLGHSMQNSNIHSGDILVVDRAVTPGHNHIAVAVIDGEFTVKRIAKRGGKLFLIPENENFHAIEIKDGMNVEIWGVVTHVIHSLKL